MRTGSYLHRKNDYQNADNEDDQMGPPESLEVSPNFLEEGGLACWSSRDIILDIADFRLPNGVRGVPDAGHFVTGALQQSVSKEWMRKGEA